ncbi:MAG: alpha-2-macroglobulin family protein [Patescibacteria group bacterium]|nr:alpha-2-macroglobulin family protein [Patescibacteria group bacterium]
MPKQIFQKTKQFLIKQIKRKRVAVAASLFLFIAVISGILFYIYDKKPESLIPRVEYAKAFSLVNDKISQSASITINIPPNMEISKQEAKDSVEFYPEIDGEWIESGNEKKVVFDPDEKLKMGRYYEVALKIKEKNIGSDFLVVDDPKVLTVFPKAGSEASEDSEITVMFNRPMTPITTLDVLADFDIPIEVEPATEGKFKWIGTRTVQFIADERLTRSSNYAVKIKSDFASMDGLKIDDFEHQFKTRVLRYQLADNKHIIYNSPIRIAFNQPVDLRKTMSEITIKNVTANNQQIDFVAEYGTKNTYNKESEKYEKTTNESVIYIYNKKDRHGRGKLWDFNNSYHLKINKAYPQEGDIILEEARELTINVSGEIKQISASSERTSFSTPDFFDPQGKLWIGFYEDIDLAKSKISANEMIEIGYGKKCKEKEEDLRFGENVKCEKEDDQKRIYLSFDYGKINNSDVLKLNFDKIINKEGLQLNVRPIVKDIKIIPRLKILRTIPEYNASNASLSEFIICSNSPLSVPAKEDVSDYIKANPGFEFKYWNRPIKVTKNNVKYRKCHINEFETKIAYGLMPESDYEIEIKVVDNFDEEEMIKKKFRTGKMPEHHLNFHNFQRQYSITTPDKTKLTYAVENMDYVNFHICKLKPQDMLYYLENKPSYTNSSYVVGNCEKVVSKKIGLQKKYWVRNYFTVNLEDYLEDPLGHYILTFSHPDYKTRWGNKKQVHERTYLTVTNLGIVEKRVEIRNSSNNWDVNLNSEQQARLKNIYWVTDLKSANPIAGAKVQLFEGVKENSKVKMKKLSSYFTDRLGIAEVAVANNLHGVVVTKGNDSALITRYDNKLGYGSVAKTAQKIYSYTDRPIYKPGQEVHIKGLYRIGYDGDYEIFRDKKIPLKVYNSKNEEILSQELEVNDFGTFNTKLILDTKASLGRYRIVAKNAKAYFEVEEYVPAPFKVETKTDKEEYISGDMLNLDIDASYYFGAAVEGGEVEYSIGSQDYYFDKYTDEYFNFGSRWYYCYDCSYGDKFILRNKTELDSSGKAKISHRLDLNKLFADQKDVKSKIFVVYITIKNSNGQAVSAQKSFVVHRGEYYLGLKTDKYFLSKNESFKAKVKSVNTEGKEISVQNIKLQINKIKWVQNKRKEVDGGYYYKWEKELELIQEKTISTNQNSDWSGNFSLDKEGEYELKATSKDSRGNIITNSYNIYVYGNAQVDVRRTNDTELEIVVDKSDLEIDNQAKIIIKSPYKKARALISIERGKVFKYEIVDINQSLYNYSFPVLAEYTPNFYVSVILLSADSNPEVKFGQVQFKVDTERKELDVSVKPDKKTYLPGEEVVLNLEAKDYAGNPAETEFSVAVADLSVLALKGNPKKNPLVFFYGGFPLTISTSSNLENILYEVDIASGTKGGGGAESEDLAKKKRGIFKDTALWQAVVRTDKNGKAEIKFTLPDNLTTWQVESVGISKDTKLGVDYQDFIARKDIMVIPLKPRFIVPGDEFYLGAKIFNQTKQKQNLRVEFKSGTLFLKNDSGKKDVQIEANGSETVYFNVTAEQSKQNGIHKFVLFAKNSAYEDTVENTIKITRNDTYETTATAGYSNATLVEEFVYLPEDIVGNKGELTIQNSATLAVFLSDALNYLLGYPYGCSEQIASKLASIAIVKKGLNLENVGDKFELENIEFDGQEYTIDEIVEIGLARIYENQKSNGGFAYYPDGNPNIYLTLHITNTLKDLKDAGYEINDNSLKRAFVYINNTASYDKNLQENKDLIILATNSLLEIKEYGKINNSLTSYIKGLRSDNLLLNEQISNTSLTTLAVMLSENEDIFSNEYKNEVFDILENKIDIDSRGAFLPSNKNTLWQFYGTQTKDTALLLKALSKDERDNEILDRILRWLLQSRDKDGSWGSTNNTISVIDAMTDYLIWQRETESEFTLKILLDDDEKQSFDYNEQTIFNQNSLTIPVSELGLGSFSSLAFKKENHNKLNNNFYYDISLKYFLPIDTIPPRDEGFSITREFYHLEDKEGENPVTQASPGDVLRGHIKIFVPEGRNFVAVEDFIPAGAELINFNLATENKSLLAEEQNNYDWWRGYYDNRKLRPNVKELRDDRLFLFKERLPAGEYEYDYYVRVLIPGKFHHLPAVVSEMYFPENFARTNGRYFKVK